MVRSVVSPGWRQSWLDINRQTSSPSPSSAFNHCHNDGITLPTHPTGQRWSDPALLFYVALLGEGQACTPFYSILCRSSNQDVGTIQIVATYLGNHGGNTDGENSWAGERNWLSEKSKILALGKAYMKKGEFLEILSPQIFWIFRKILGWEREINTAPKPSPEVAPSKMEVAPS